MDQCREREMDTGTIIRVISGSCQDIHTFPSILGLSYQNQRPDQLTYDYLNPWYPSKFLAYSPMGSIKSVHFIMTLRHLN